MPSDHPTLKRYLSQVRRRAHSYQRAYELTPASVHSRWLAQDCRCFYSGRPVSFMDGSASIDRRDPSGGYTEDNVSIVHRRVNNMKLDLSEAEFLMLLRAVDAQSEARA